MANDCLPQVQACRIRVARLAVDGAPAPGASGLYVSKALVSLAFRWEISTGAEIAEPNACGEEMVYFKAPDNVRRGSVTIRIITPDPQLSEMLSAGVVLTNGAAVGAGAPPLGLVPDDAPVSIELWAKRIRAGKADPTFPWARWAYPYITNLRPEDHEHANANLATSFVGDAFENENWFDGPTNDWPVASDRVWQWIPTADDPPADVCGYQALVAS